MKVLILGANGMLGHKLYQVLSSDSDLDVYGTIRRNFDQVSKYGLFDKNNIFIPNNKPATKITPNKETKFIAGIMERYIAEEKKMPSWVLDTVLANTIVKNPHFITDTINILIKAKFSPTGYKDLHIYRAIDRCRPDIIINCIGIVDKSYAEENIPEATEVNTLLPRSLKEVCLHSNTRLIHISTDCVFSGREGNYTETSLADATDVYGLSKKWGEVTGDNVLTIRTSIIGRELVRSRGLLEWFISNRGGTVDGYANAIFSGFPTVTFAGIIKDIILNHSELNGLYHIATEPIDKYTLLNMINDTMHLGIKINKSPDYKYDRSLDATKFNKATRFKPQPWGIMIDELAKDAKQYEAWR